MDNFFGLGTCNSIYDGRRHVNVMYAIFIEARRIADGEPFMFKYINILKSPASEAAKAAQVKSILTETEYQYLRYMGARYGLSEEEFTTILSGRTMFDKEMRTPAGYYAADNWRLLTHMVYATCLLPDRYRQNEREIILGPIKGFISCVRGINYQYNTISTASEALNECLDKGLRYFEDLPEIENHVIKKAQARFGSF